ncbi:Rho guanine nucleotide exchange factor [Marasmius tenuissimus]|uniref:Rho guanine nucleotide exchange factor n=1 Tax=Marasmius tenuissimus TaxID=585030 RepID=A0ABR2Z947_9AGAR
MRCLSIFTGLLPFPDLMNDMAVMLAVVQGKRPSRPQEISELSDTMWALMTACWDVAPSFRPTASHVLEKVGEMAPRAMNTPASDWSEAQFAQVRENVEYRFPFPPTTKTLNTLQDGANHKLVGERLPLGPWQRGAMGKQSKRPADHTTVDESPANKRPRLQDPPVGSQPIRPKTPTPPELNSEPDLNPEGPPDLFPVHVTAIPPVLAGMPEHSSDAMLEDRRVVALQSRAPTSVAPQHPSPLWQGVMRWPPDSMNGKRAINAHITVFAANNNRGHPETWPATIHLTSSTQPISPTDLQAWFTQYSDRMVLGTLTPGSYAPHQVYQDFKFLFATLMTQRIYLLGAWIPIHGGRLTNNLLIAATPNSGLLGAFFPYNGLPELPKATSPVLPMCHFPLPRTPPPESLGGTADALLPDSREDDLGEGMVRVREITDINQRAMTAEIFLIRLQQASLAGGRPLTAAELVQKMGVMNVNPAQMPQITQRIQRMSMMAPVNGGDSGNTEAPRSDWAIAAS